MRVVLGFLALVAGCSSSPTPRVAEPPPLPPPPPAHVVDLDVHIDGRVVVLASDGTVRIGPMAGPLVHRGELDGAVQVATARRATCARFADDTAVCVDDAGRAVLPRTTGVRWLGSGTSLRVVTAAGPELWSASDREIGMSGLPGIDGQDAQVPTLDSFDLSRNYGCGVSRGIAFCWGMDVPFFDTEQPDDHGDWGQDLFLRARTVLPAGETARVEVYQGGVCLLDPAGALRECRGLIDVGSGNRTECAPGAPCRCGASRDRAHVVCEGRSSSIPAEVTTWVDDVVLLARARCFVTVSGGVGCFGERGVEPLADLPLP